ncbi:unnamed protein product [Phytomonas sp. EM1]|nr:unnamed protein product [Phytomonas sp. EM1]|eukprot:CCW61408.1 unnamed protein product [Phytomonas sp. isolate EM1]
MIPKGISATSRWVSRLPPFARRALQVDQMEFDSALSQMYSLCIQPSLVGKMSKARKMTKNHYYRDDPAFLVIQLLFTLLTTGAYGATFSESFSQVVGCFFYEVFVVYYLCGILFSSLIWITVNHFLVDPNQFNEVSRETEWRYSFDVHCNGYFIYFIWTKVIKFILLPVLYSNSSFVSQILSNSLYLFGASAYFYSIFLGYLELPVLTQQQRLMYPVPVLILLIVVITLFSHTNLTVWSVHFYWLPAGKSN